MICRHICFVNPTTKDYSYRWSNLSNDFNEEQPIVRCLSEFGTSEKGTRTRTSFSFVSKKFGLFESFWQFEIRKYNLKTLFIILANVVEPNVCCQNSVVKLKTTLIGIKALTKIFETFFNTNM